MRLLLSLFVLLSTVTAAYAPPPPITAVPEIDALAGLSALAVIGSVAMLVWERRRK